MKHLAAGEVPAEPQERQTVPQLTHVAGPELDRVVRPHHPLAVRLVDQDGAVERCAHSTIVV